MISILIRFLTMLDFYLHIFGPLLEKTKDLSFQPDLTQIGLYSHRRML